MPADDLLNIADAARLLRVSDQTLRRWTDKGHIRCVRSPSGYRRYRVSDIEQMRRTMGFNHDTEPRPARPATPEEK